METINQIQLKLEDLESNITFYKKEVNFLLKILTKEYTSSITDTEVIKLLDSYWKELEKSQLKFKELESKLKIKEQEALFFCKNKVEGINATTIENDNIVMEYVQIVHSLKNIKERMYNYMENKLKRSKILTLADIS